jgi:hypothetical protein
MKDWILIWISCDSLDIPSKTRETKYPVSAFPEVGIGFTIKLVVPFVHRRQYKIVHNSQNWLSRRCNIHIKRQFQTLRDEHGLLGVTHLWLTRSLSLNCSMSEIRRDWKWEIRLNRRREQMKVKGSNWVSGVDNWNWGNTIERNMSTIEGEGIKLRRQYSQLGENWWTQVPNSHIPWRQICQLSTIMIVSIMCHFISSQIGSVSSQLFVAIYTQK